jgi:hypothetical protein
MQDFAFGGTIDPVAAEGAPRSSVVGSAEATCVLGADFNPNKPNNFSRMNHRYRVVAAVEMPTAAL